jgi:hypothetical protein
MTVKINFEERKILETLNEALNHKPAGAMIDQIVTRVEQKLARHPDALMAWEPVPLDLYAKELPDVIRSSWIFILRGKATTGAERHPNSHQRMMSYRGSGDLQVWGDERWHSNFLVSEFDAPLQSRWVSIPPYTWHQAVVPQKDWIVVSFHTVREDELIEERPDPNDTKPAHQRRYVDE